MWHYSNVVVTDIIIPAVPGNGGKVGIGNVIEFLV